MIDLKYIAVEGLVKSGKTKLARILAEEFKARLFLDNAANPFLNDYYGSVSSGSNPMALKTQLIYLINRFNQQLEMKQKDLFQKTMVSNYIFYKDGIYAHTVLNDEDLDIYKRILGIFAEKVHPCSLVVYLQTSFAEMLQRIHKQGSEHEKRAPTDYWREIFEAYNYYFFNYKLSPLLVVNVEKIDFNSRKDIDGLIQEIRNHKKGSSYYAPA
ncbi:MAG: deoxynucleoside kinase [Acidobacteria bacterium]|jgi:deoxyadenosine/deoxycytidine kinase|nr:deoxynucleoside kinase [Acidobacteriota bacterium]